MRSLTRLVTVVELDDGANGPRSMSVSALHLAVLDDGTRRILLDDRGWSAGGPDGLWERMTVEEIAETAVTVVGPDEPDEDLTPDDMAQAHWEYLAEHLRTQGVAARAAELSRLQHDVDLSQRLRARLGRP
ncbi:hypothetical protein NMQ01_00565 [Janibacter sp. CX7]|uniref:hypothetical protein n=1 Tax=Janibacter sp. CX7 TaxID=2963431 RepID=UPI0020CCE30D|nr:hypothetical protein [Janibacter sp. CX7]UTT66245.1 hypothetical protein NMQ01_00565 [Janibacter sp. CX7]